jgi:hypothetical protein
MVSQGSSHFWNWVGNWFNRLVPVMYGVGVVLVIALITGLIVFALDRQAFQKARDWTVQNALRLLIWIPVLAAVAFADFSLNIVQYGVTRGIANQEGAQFGTRARSYGGGTTQYSPSVSFEQQTTLKRSFTIPPEIATKLGENPEEVLQRYINDNPTNRTVTKVDDAFTRRGNALLYERTVLVSERKPVALEVVDVGVMLEGVANSSEGAYKAKFDGRYSFGNPQAQPTPMRFIFPLPDSSGTLSGFQMTLNGQPVQVADLSNGYVWEGTLPANAKAEVRITYTNQGADVWNYDFGQRREPIRDFKLRVTTPRNAEFDVTSLFPTSEATRAYEWRLQNVITSQNIAVSLPSRQYSLSGTLNDLYSFAPLAMLAMVAWALALAWRRELKLEPARLIIAVLALTVGVALSGVLIWYLPVAVAGLIGAFLAIALGIGSLGRDYALPVGLSGLAPLAFLSADAALILMVLAVVALSTLIPGDTRANLRRLVLR